MECEKALYETKREVRMLKKILNYQEKYLFQIENFNASSNAIVYCNHNYEKIIAVQTEFSKVRQLKSFYFALYGMKNFRNFGYLDIKVTDKYLNIENLIIHTGYENKGYGSLLLGESL